MSFQYAGARPIVLLFVALAHVQGQTAPVPEQTAPQGSESTNPRPNPDRRGLRPLTPQEQREQAIRKYDPRSGVDPLGREQDTGLIAPPSQRDGTGGTPGSTNSSGSNQGGSNRSIPLRSLPAPRPLPGSVAASREPDLANPRSQGPQILDPTQDNSAQDYGGPSVLSRSYTLSRPSLPQEIKWTPTVGVNEAYETGIQIPGALGGPPTTASAFGTVVTWGLAGRHLWKREQIAVAYSGNLSRYAGARNFNGGNNSLTIQYSRLLTRHLIFSLAEAASSTSQSQSLLSSALPAGSSIANVNLALSPGVQPIDQGLRQFSSSPSLTWKKNARMTVTVGGGIFFVERKQAGLGGTTGHQAQADVTYRYSRKLTVGSYYSFTNYIFTKHVSVSSSNTFGGIVSYSLNRSTEFRLRMGLSQVESQSLLFVPFPLELVPLLGQLGAIAVSYNKSKLQDISAEFARDFSGRKTMRVSYAKGLAPGNGTIRTSSREALSGSFNMTLFGKYRANAGVNLDRLSAVDGTQQAFSTRSFQFNVSRSYAHDMTSTFGVDVRTFTTPATGIPQQQIRFSTGISWSPQDGRLW